MLPPRHYVRRNSSTEKLAASGSLDLSVMDENCQAVAPEYEVKKLKCNNYGIFVSFVRFVVTSQPQ